MRRRDTGPETPMPTELVTLKGWPGTVAEWCAARWEWARDHGWPVDPIDLLKENAAAKRANRGRQSYRTPLVPFGHLLEGERTVEAAPAKSEDEGVPASEPTRNGRAKQPKTAERKPAGKPDEGGDGRDG